MEKLEPKCNEPTCPDDLEPKSRSEDAYLKCNTWPNSSNYGCNKEGDDWKLLDSETFGTAECQSLCRLHATNEGCCFVSDSYGCAWKGGAAVTNDPNDDGLAVACTFVKRPECNANECLCISNGGNTCGATKDEECDPDGCYDHYDCVGILNLGYWCDDSNVEGPFNKTCCIESGVPETCIGLCTPATKSVDPVPRSILDRTDMPSNACDKWEKTIEECMIKNPKFHGEFAETQLRKHNFYRAKHGSPPMSLDRDLTKAAEDWARTIARGGAFEHSSTQVRGLGIGENLAHGCGTGKIRDSVTDIWYEEVINPGYNFHAKDLITKFDGTNSFTQVIWKASIKLGIAITEGQENGMYCTYIVARYSPGGNVPGEYQENVLPPIDGEWLSEFKEVEGDYSRLFEKED